MYQNLKRTTIALALLATQPALAGGLWITEYGQPTQGRAGAGEQAGTGNASDAFLNPAAMTRLETSELLVSGGLIYSSVEFDVERAGIVNGTGDGGDAGSLAPGGSAYYAHPINDRWSVGIAGVALTGAVLDYDDDHWLDSLPY